jgi:hypothetical protein
MLPFFLLKNVIPKMIKKDRLFNGQKKDKKNINRQNSTHKNDLATRIQIKYKVLWKG